MLGGPPPGDPQLLPNIRRLLVSVAPAVPTREACVEPCCTSFALADLWHAMELWSAFGVEVPLSLGPDGEVTQTYVPYLSSIQLFARDRRKDAPGGETSDDEGRAPTPSTTTAAAPAAAVAPTPAATAAPAAGRASPGSPSSASSDSGASSDGPCSLDGWAASVLTAAPPPSGEPPRGPPLFEWSESAPPHERPPLTDRVRGLAAAAGAAAGGKEGAAAAAAGGGASLLLSASSADLHPASWFAVAWYPLYTLPAATGRAARDLGGAFLTLHSLAPPAVPGGAGGGRAPAGASPATATATATATPASPSPCACASAPAVRPNQPTPPDLGPIAAAVAEGRRAAAAAATPGPGSAVLLPAWGLAVYKVPSGPAPPSAPPGAPLPLGGPWADPAGAATVAAMRAAAVAWVDRRRAPAADLAFFASRAPRA